MKLHRLNKLTGLGFASLCLAWSGLSYAGDIPPENDITTVSKASVKIQSYEQTASGVTEKVTVKTDDVINALTGKAPGTKPPKNQQLVLLNYCGEPQNYSAMGVWDKDASDLVDLVDDAETDKAICLRREGPALFNDKQDKIYTTWDIGQSDLFFGMSEIDMSVEIKGGKVKKKVDSSRPVCLKKLKTLAMGAYYGEGEDENGSRVLRKTGSIKTNGAVIDTFEGNTIGTCTPWDWD